MASKAPPPTPTQAKAAAAAKKNTKADKPQNAQLENALAEQARLQSRVKAQEAELKALRAKKGGGSAATSFASQLKAEGDRFAKLQQKLSRLETQAKEQKKQLLAEGRKRYEGMQVSIRDLQPKLGKLETQYAAQQLELASVSATHNLELALLRRSVASMSEGTQALITALDTLSAKQSGRQMDSGTRLAANSILEARRTRLEQSVREMKADVKRAQGRLESAKKATATRKASISKIGTEGSGGGGHRRTASTQMSELVNEMEKIRATRKADAVKSAAELAQLRATLKSASERANRENEADMKDAKDSMERKRVELEAQAQSMMDELDAAERQARRNLSRRKLFEKEFELLKLALDEARVEHEKKVQTAEDAIAMLETNLEGRRARTRAERERALLIMENEIRTSLGECDVLSGPLAAFLYVFVCLWAPVFKTKQKLLVCLTYTTPTQSRVH